MDIGELKRFFLDEIKEKEEEGCNVSFFKKFDLELLTEDSLLNFYNLLSSLKPSENFLYIEPSSLEEIKKYRPDGPRKLDISLSEETLRDKILGGILGRCIGCLLGKPVEGWRKEDIEEYLSLADTEELNYYFPYLESEEEPFKRIKQVKNWTAGNIDRMVRDDDIDYTILGLHILETYGDSFTTKDIANEWLTHLPYLLVYTAERVAYRNLVNGIEPPKTATFINPYREWIGAQIRADIFGYVNPGWPERAGEFAYRDACLSHVKNGIYGEMFISAAIASAFVVDDVESAIEIGLTEIPKTSRLYEAINNVIDWCRKDKDWKNVWTKVMDQYGSYHPVHTINNACFVVLGLILSEGDFEKAITTSVMCGFDTDCNGATSGSIMGVLLGSNNLPSKWIEPLNDTVESIVIGFERSKISGLAERIYKLVKG
ncbi:MAG: ADP-ribosylglycohydrolase family protein [bacterium]